MNQMCLDRYVNISQKLGVLYKGLEVESKTDYMDFIFFKVTGKSMNRENSLSRRVD